MLDLTLSVTSFTGELAALSAAFIWAIASLIYTRVGKQVSPLALNLVKGAIAIGFLLLTLTWRGEFLPDTSLRGLILLLLSGAVGIGFGDTAFFASLNCMGARRALLMDALAPPLTALLALLFLQEQLNVKALLGILLTISGVAWVVSERIPNAALGSTNLLRGVIYGLLAVLGQSVGAVMSRAALIDTNISPLWSTLLRLSAGVLVLLVWVLLQQQVKQEFKPVRSHHLLGVITIASFFSTYLAIWLQQISLKFTAAGIAQALSATSPLFILPIAACMGEAVSFRAVLGVVVTLGGIWLLFG